MVIQDSICCIKAKTLHHLLALASKIHKTEIIFEYILCMSTPVSLFLVLFLGGLIGTVPYHNFDGKVTFYNYMWAGIYSMAVGLLIMIIEYPRGKRMKGSVMERR